MKNKKNLIAVLSSFSFDSGLDNTQIFGMLEISIKNGVVDLHELKKELDESILGDCDWVELAVQTNLLEEPNLYKNNELINYIKVLLWDYLYPENMLTTGQIDQLKKNVTAILQEFSENEGWMFSYDLYKTLKENEEYYDFEYYNLWKLNFYNSNIERKPIEEKYQEIGYLRYKENKK